MYTQPMLSILILTHNRPELFNQCIRSLLKLHYPFQIEVLVNNDSNDIHKVYSGNSGTNQIKIKYFYEANTDLSLTYKFLFEKANGKFIYFLEDDDLLLPGFISGLKYISSPKPPDIIMGLYRCYNSKHQKLLINEYYKNKDIRYVPEFFQLSQIIFRKNCLKDIDFPTGNNIENDEKLFRSISTQNFINLPILFFQQRVDGKNLSLKELIK